MAPTRPFATGFPFQERAGGWNFAGGRERNLSPDAKLMSSNPRYTPILTGKWLRNEAFPTGHARPFKGVKGDERVKRTWETACSARKQGVRWQAVYSTRH